MGKWKSETLTYREVVMLIHWNENYENGIMEYRNTEESHVGVMTYLNIKIVKIITKLNDLREEANFKI